MEMLANLSAGLAHDFNNVLAAIIGHTQLAQADLPDTGRVHDNLDQVLHAAKRASSLVQRFLRIRYGGAARPIEVSLGSVAREVVRLVRPTLAPTIRMKTHIATDCGAVVGDALQREHMVTNLCVNAGRAMRERGGTLTVSVDDVRVDCGRTCSVGTLEAGRYLAVAVADTGHGVRTDTVQEIFEPFRTSWPEGVGTGIGLAVVRSIVTAHSGAIEVESVPSVSTTFTVFLPLGRDTRPTNVCSEVRYGSSSSRRGRRSASTHDEADAGTCWARGR